MDMTPTQTTLLERESRNSLHTDSSVDIGGDLQITNYSKSSLGSGFSRHKTLWGRGGKLCDSEITHVSRLPVVAKHSPDITEKVRDYRVTHKATGQSVIINSTSNTQAKREAGYIGLGKPYMLTATQI